MSVSGDTIYPIKQEAQSLNNGCGKGGLAQGGGVFTEVIDAARPRENYVHTWFPAAKPIGRLSNSCRTTFGQEKTKRIVEIELIRVDQSARDEVLHGLAQ